VRLAFAGGLRARVEDMLEYAGFWRPTHDMHDQSTILFIKKKKVDAANIFRKRCNLPLLLNLILNEGKLELQ
jgi:hypothetical protein